jgi:hypothetical protein
VKRHYKIYIDQVKRFEDRCKNCHRWKTSFEEGAYATNFINQFKEENLHFTKLFGPWLLL